MRCWVLGDDVKLVRETRLSTSDDVYVGKVRVHACVCYDFLVSLRALHNPRTFTRTRRWAAVAKDDLGSALRPTGQFFFQGFDTALGYGAARLIDQLPPQGDPADLIEAVRAADPRRLALLMLDTGETSLERLERYRGVLGGSGSLDGALTGLGRGWASRCRRVLAEPALVQAELTELLSGYLSRVYAAVVPLVRQALERAVSAAESLLGLLSTVDAIEQLTGGYTLGRDLGLRSITLAPSPSIYPFMSTRIDELSKEALVIYGVPSAIFASYDTVPIERNLADALRALADPNRLTTLGLLAQRPMYTTELVEALRLSQPTVHYHLTQLRAAGLVRQRRDKGGMRYSIRHDSTVQILQSLEALILGGSRCPAEGGNSRERTANETR